MKNYNYNDFIELLISKSKQNISEFESISPDPFRTRKIEKDLGIPAQIQSSILIQEVKKNLLTQWITKHKDEFKLFMNELFNASLHVEEGRQVCIRIALSLPNMEPDIKFTSPLLFEAKRIVKVAPSINLWDRHLFIKPDENEELKIFGFRQQPYAGWDSINKRTGGSGHSTQVLSIEIHGPGEIRVDYPFNCEYNKGEIGEFSDFYSIKAIDKWLTDIALQIDKWQEIPTYDGSKPPSSSAGMKGSHFFKPTLTNILKYMREGKHGGCLAIVPNNKQDWVASMELKDYEVNSEYLLEAMKKRYKSAPALDYLIRINDRRKKYFGLFAKDKNVDDVAKEIDNLHFSERELEQAERFISSLSYIDGAVVLSRDLNLIGFGVRFTAKLERESTIKNVGMRHKSAHDFCCKVKDSIAIVVSQDGGITVFSNDGADFCKEERVILNYNRTDA